MFFPGPGTRGGARRRGAAAHAQKTVERVGRGHRAPRALRRAVPLQEVEGAAGAGEADADRPARAGAQRGRCGEAALLSRRTPHARLRVPQAGAQRARPWSRPTASTLGRGREALLGGASFALERGEHVALVGPNGSGKTTLLETILGRRAPDGGHGPARPRRRARVLLAARGRARRARHRCSSAQGRDRALSARRRRRCSAASSSRAGRSTRSRSPCSPAASGAGSRSRSSSPPARTSSSSTSRRTTSTSRAARRSRRRWRRSRARCCSSRTTARCSTRSPDGRSRSRTATRALLRRRLGRLRPAPRRARAARPRARAEARREGRSRRSRRAAPRRASSSASRPRSRNARRESPSSSDASPTTGATSTCSPRTGARARSSQALLERWEELFEQAQAVMGRPGCARRLTGSGRSTRATGWACGSSTSSLPDGRASSTTSCGSRARRRPP